MAPKGPKKAEDRLKVGPRGPKMGPRWPKMGPRWAQDAPRWPLQAQQIWPKMAARWPQDGLKMGPRWVPNRSSKAFQHRSRKRETPGQSQMPIWADVGPFWGLYGASWAHVRAPLRHLKMIRAQVKKKGLKGQVGDMLASDSWPLKGILRHLNIMLPTKVNLRGGGPNFGGFCRAPGAPGEEIKGRGLIN